jgi:ferrous iron transport protein A
MAPERRELQVVNVNAGKGLSRRLMELGFCDEAVVTVMKSGPSGPLIIQLNNSRFALGRGMAMKIIVREAK